MASGDGPSPRGDGNGRLSGGMQGAVPVDWERLARTTAHPLRVSILEILGLDGGRALSPNDLSQELQIPLSNTNYHVTELAKGGLIELCGQRRVRGATEHFYRLPAAPHALPAIVGTDAGTTERGTDGGHRAGSGPADLRAARAG